MLRKYKFTAHNTGKVLFETTQAAYVSEVEVNKQTRMVSD